MTKIFPEASDYKTITQGIGLDQKETIEKRLGESISPGEGKDWIYYEITDQSGKTLGYITADAETGEYGVIEMVMGITPDRKIKGVYIQRSREKDKEFQSRAFLDQFTGKTMNDHVEDGMDIPFAGGSTAQQKVVFGVRKMLLFYEELGR
jgi:Na+-translocating ferredoxin:NAD+ oxidoreductase RnfG subunit